MEALKTRFFGRKTLVGDLVQGVLTPSQPLDFSLVGPKMIGKSRLLNHLASAEGPLRGPDPSNWRPERFRDGHNVMVALYDCDWPEARANLLEFVWQQLRLQLEADKKLGLNWSLLDSMRSPGQRIGQLVRQLEQRQIRLVLILDNFDHLLRNELAADMANELRPLTNDLGLIVATEQPLHDLNRSLASSPLFNVMHQHFIGLLEPEAVQEWLDAYAQRFAWTPAVGRALREMAGGHPFLLSRINDILLEVEALAVSPAPIDTDRLALIRLRLIEHGRPLFDLLWRKINETRLQAVPALVRQLVGAPVSFSQINGEQVVALNWLINQAVIVYDNNVYQLFSPLFRQYLLDQVGLELPVDAGPARPLEPPSDIFASLTPKEADLLRYFQAHSCTVISVEQLLADVWNSPGASARRVQEAIRRLRSRLSQHTPPVGVIENERGLGYRYIPG